MLVSIVTVCYNSENTVRATIESVLAQTYDKIEYLIIDGASSDGTVAIAEEYRERFAEKGYAYTIVSEKDNGIYDAMNKGINMARGEIIGIINSDDWYESLAVETVVNTYKKSPYDMFYASINLVKESGKTIVKKSKYDKFPTSRHWNHPTSFVTKKTYEELGAFRCEGIHDDFDFLLRVKKAGKKIVIGDEVLANFRTGGTSNDKSIKKCIRRCKDRYKCYRNNKYSRFYMIECVLMEISKFILS
jgi:glycosyltransferase involved in cell wall biosynthesis